MISTTSALRTIFIIYDFTMLVKANCKIGYAFAVALQSDLNEQN